MTDEMEVAREIEKSMTKEPARWVEAGSYGLSEGGWKRDDGVWLELLPTIGGPAVRMHAGGGSTNIQDRKACRKIDDAARALALVKGEAVRKALTPSTTND